MGSVRLSIKRSSDLKLGRHNLQGTRPLPQAPLCDLLPSGYLSSLKRTEARVRFAEDHAGPSGSQSNPPESGPSKTSPTDQEESDQSRELGSLAFGAEEAIAKLSEAVTAMDPVDTSRNEELQQQLNQLNLPDGSVDLPSELSDDKSFTFTTLEPSKPQKSNLHSPNPPNLALAILKLIELYVEGMREIPEDEGGWDLARRERGFNLVKALSEHLGKAERLSSSEYIFFFIKSVLIPSHRPSSVTSYSPPLSFACDLPCSSSMFPSLCCGRLALGIYHLDCWLVSTRFGSTYRRSKRCVWLVR